MAKVGTLTIEQKGCNPVYKWLTAQQALTNETVIEITSDSVNLTYGTKLVGTSYQVNTIKPISITTPNNAAIEVKAMNIDVKTFLKKQGDLDCPDFMLTIIIGTTTVFNDMTNG